MEQEQVRRVPIVDEARSLVGVVSMADVARRARNRQDLEAQVVHAEESICQPSA
jgi:CBS domain-containing protein